MKKNQIAIDDLLKEPSELLFKRWPTGGGFTKTRVFMPCDGFAIPLPTGLCQSGLRSHPPKRNANARQRDSELTSLGSVGIGQLVFGDGRDENIVAMSVES